MKSSFARFSVVAAVLGGLGLASVLGVERAVAARAAQAPAGGGLKVAYVDLSRVFEHYEKLTHLRESVKESAEVAKEKAMGLAEQAKSLQEQLKSGEFEEGSDEWLERETKIIQLSSRFETFKALTQKNIGKQEAEAISSVYKDVQDALAQFAELNGYTLVLQINREAFNPQDSQKISIALRSTIVRHNKGDDITDPVLAWLNRQYAANGDSKPAAATTTSKAKPALATQPTAKSTKSAPKKTAAAPSNKTSR